MVSYSPTYFGGKYHMFIANSQPDRFSSKLNEYGNFEVVNQKHEETKVPPNLFGSRTYTSPASFDSSSGNSTGKCNVYIKNSLMSQFLCLNITHFSTFVP